MLQQWCFGGLLTICITIVLHGYYGVKKIMTMTIFWVLWLNKFMNENWNSIEPVLQKPCDTNTATRCSKILIIPTAAYLDSRKGHVSRWEVKVQDCWRRPSHREIWSTGTLNALTLTALSRHQEQPLSSLHKKTKAVHPLPLLPERLLQLDG